MLPTKGEPWEKASRCCPWVVLYLHCCRRVGANSLLRSQAVPVQNNSKGVIGKRHDCLAAAISFVLSIIQIFSCRTMAKAFSSVTEVNSWVRCRSRHLFVGTRWTELRVLTAKSSFQDSRLHSLTTGMYVVYRFNVCKVGRSKWTLPTKTGSGWVRFQTSRCRSETRWSTGEARHCCAGSVLVSSRVDWFWSLFKSLTQIVFCLRRFWEDFFSPLPTRGGKQQNKTVRLVADLYGNFKNNIAMFVFSVILKLESMYWIHLQ